MAANGDLMAPNEPIAIIGISCRFPGDASSPSKLWDLCASGRSVWSPIPHERFDVQSWYDADPEKVGRTHVKGGHFLSEDLTRFDAGFFNLPADVASAMDPQIRFLLENVYEATEDAGIPLERLAGSNTSVFSGCFIRDYYDIQMRDPESLPSSLLVGNYTTMFANRISHFYDLHGASMTIDTGCSSSLVALHQGCQTIHSGESDLSIVGASSLLLSQDMFITMSTIGMVGAKGKSYSWDTRAEGYGRGEGVAALILKSLKAATRDGDHIHAVIRDIGLNQDGKTATITSPSAEAQVKLIKSCYKRAGIDISETSYLEAHMTGTKIGDAVEAEAIARTFGKRRTGEPILVGSIKTNIGHTEAVSGLAAVIKTAFTLKHGQIAPNTNYDKPNPNIRQEEWNMRVPKTLTEWPQGRPLRASVNSFGYGGSNAHAILESAPCDRPYTNGVNGHSSHRNGTYNSESAPRMHSLTNRVESHSIDSNGTQGCERSRVYILSAKDSGACLEMARNLAAFLRLSIRKGHKLTSGDLAYTLLERRSRLPWTVAIRASNIEDLAERLEQPTIKALQATKHPRIGFVFNGQGAQWYAMGRELITAYPVFGVSIDKADRILKGYGAHWSLYDELMRDESCTRVGEINLSQPISVALQLCLVDLMKSWGITPSAVTSHSSGEIAAAYSVNALSFEEALGVVFFRGELALKYQKLAPHAGGGMLAAGISPDQAKQYTTNTTGGRVVVACINSPESVTLSGDLPALDKVASRLKRDGLFARRLNVPLAYHSHHMLPMAQEYVDKLRAIVPKDPAWDERITFVSPVTGHVISPKILTPEHWARNLTNPVLFSQAFESMCTSNANLDLVVEVGAHSTLAGPIRQILGSRKMPYIPSLKRSTNAVETMQGLACELLARGYLVDLKAVNLPFGNEPDVFIHGLPTYPWNHSTQYWVESRVNRETRYKKFPPHELLGLPISGGTGPTTTWRKFLRLSDLSWLVDHQVDSKVVLPAAAYISMTIEAVRFLTQSSAVRGYRLRDVNVINALTIPESSVGIEVHTQLRPCTESELDHRGWYAFEISSFDTSDTCITHCNGFVSAEMDSIAKSTLFRNARIPRGDCFFGTDTRVRGIDIESLYATMRQMNIYHGPAFRNLVDGLQSGGKAMSTLAVPNVASETTDYVIHPTTLDNIIQAAFVAFPKDLTKGVMVLPRSIGSLYVPCDLNRQAGSRLRAFAQFIKSGRRGLASSITVSSVDSHESPDSLLHMDDFYCQAVPLDVEIGASSRESSICFKTRWEMDIFHQIPVAIKESLNITLSDKEIEFEKKSVRSAYHLIYDAVAELKNQPKDFWKWHHRKFYDWMEHVVTLGASGKLRPGCTAWSRSSKGMKQMLYDELSEENVAGKLTIRMGRQLARIIRGEIAPLELVEEGDLLNHYYMENPRLKSRTYKHLGKVVELYAAKNPGAKVLEIGARTGGATQTVLQAFASRGDGFGTLLGHYTFTDASVNLVQAAGEKLTLWKDMVDYVKLDIESDPVEQSFTAGSFDLIVASMALNATKSSHKALSHVRKLLKPGGKLLLVETTQDRLDTQLIFGTLPDWWLSEEPYRKDSPHMSLNVWAEVLSATGFTGVDFHIGDCEQAEFQSCSLILTTAATAPSYPSSMSIVYTTPLSQSWCTQLAGAIRDQMGILPTVEAFNISTPAQDKICIFTGEMSSPFVDGISKDSFAKLQNVVVNSQGLLWLSCGSAHGAQLPPYGQTQGLLRTVRLEHSSNRYVHLDFEQSSNTWSEDKISYIVHVLQQAFDYNKEHNNIEWEYAVKDSILHVPRIYEDKHEDGPNVHQDTQPQLFYQPDRTLTWEPQGSGLLSNLCFTDAVQISGDLPAGMVQIEAKAFGLNSREVMISLGQLDDAVQGYDCAGVVTGLGESTERSGLKVGDRVCGIAQGRLASSSWAYWTGVTKLPTDISWADGAAIPLAYVTAYHSLARVAGLRRGETVLIHAAAGGVGQAAIVVAQHIGAKIFVTCSTETKRDLLIEHYNIDPTNILSSRDASFASAIMTATGGKGVDVVLNSLSGPLLKATWSSIARFGRFVEIGKVDMEAARNLDMTPFGRCATYVGVDTLQLNEFNRPLAHEALAESVQICYTRAKAEGKSPVFPIQKYSISDMEKAMRQIQGGSHLGKLVLIPGDEDRVNVISRPRPLSLTDSNATYMIAGGLGGVGRAIALWMMEKGAKTILLVSRNAESHPDAENLVRKATAEGCNLHVRNCDVSSEKGLIELLAYCSSVLPPIRGVINSAMVLDDTVLESMTFDQWQRTVQSKVASSTNLHLHLPNLSFFVMLSSLTGVTGHVSQANYAAGNTFQDALARHRVASGQPAVSLDLPGVTDVGILATQDSKSGDNRVRARVEALGTVSLDIGSILPLIEAAVLRRPQQTHPDDAQVIVGLAPWDQLPDGAVVREDRRFGTLRLTSARGTVSAPAEEVATSPTQLLIQALGTSTESLRCVAEALAARLAVIFNIAVEAVDLGVPMSAHGVDSLVAVELRNWLSAAAKAKLSIFEITQGKSLMDFAALVVERSQLFQ